MTPKPAQEGPSVMEVPAETIPEPPGLPPVLDRLGTALAVADPESWTLRFENARFREWFPPAEGPPPISERASPRSRPGVRTTGWPRDAPIARNWRCASGQGPSPWPWS